MQSIQGTTDLLSPKPVQFHPLCRLDGFGRNKLGDVLYRVVYAPSRLYMVGGRWPDGKVEYRFRPLYQAKAWILERWMSAFDYCKMGRERYEIEFRDPLTGLYVQGPYPERGEYDMCFDFADTEPTQDYARRVVQMIEAGRLRPYSELVQANREHAEAEERARDNRMTDLISDASPSFHGQILSAPNGAKRSFKPEKIRRRANDLTFRGKRLPVEHNKFITA